MAKAPKQAPTAQPSKLPPAGATATNVPEIPSSRRVSGTSTPAVHAGPSHDQIARRAYEIYLSRGGMPGHAQDDWAQAERELRLGRY